MFCLIDGNQNSILLWESVQLIDDLGVVVDNGSLGTVVALMVFWKLCGSTVFWKLYSSMAQFEVVVA